MPSRRIVNVRATTLCVILTANDDASASHVLNQLCISSFLLLKRPYERLEGSCPQVPRNFHHATKRTKKLVKIAHSPWSEDRRRFVGGNGGNARTNKLIDASIKGTGRSLSR